MNSFGKELLGEVGLQLGNSAGNDQNAQGCLDNVPPHLHVLPVLDEDQELIQLIPALEVRPPPAVVMSVARAQTHAVLERPQVRVPAALHEITR